MDEHLKPTNTNYITHFNESSNKSAYICYVVRCMMYTNFLQPALSEH